MVVIAATIPIQAAAQRPLMTTTFCSAIFFYGTVLQRIDGLCDLRVDEILYGYVHNAVATDENGFTISSITTFVEKALTAGYRAMELDVGRCGLRTSVNAEPCILSRVSSTRNIVTVLSTRAFDRKSSEVIIVLCFEIGNGGR
jgi:hypothetical protein